MFTHIEHQVITDIFPFERETYLAMKEFPLRWKFVRSGKQIFVGNAADHPHLDIASQIKKEVDPQLEPVDGGFLENRDGQLVISGFSEGLVLIGIIEYVQTVVYRPLTVAIMEALIGESLINETKTPD